MQVLLKVGTVHDAILNRVGAVDEQLDLVLLSKLLHNLALALQGLLSGLLGGFCCRGHAAFYSETCLKPEDFSTASEIGLTGGVVDHSGTLKHRMIQELCSSATHKP